MSAAHPAQHAAVSTDGARRESANTIAAASATPPANSGNASRDTMPSSVSQSPMNHGSDIGICRGVPTMIQAAPVRYTACSNAFHLAFDPNGNVNGTIATATAGRRNRESPLSGIPNQKSGIMTIGTSST